MTVDPVVAIQKVYKVHGLLSRRLVSLFQKEIYRHFTAAGRDLPWRHSPTAYQVLVSEIMLQQTQVDRVIPKYHEWLRAFPTIKRLSNASLTEVLQRWSGLGYNRRARFLWQAAKAIVDRGGTFPKTIEALEELPGIGPATARSITTFAFNQSTVFIETNVRSVYLHFFFPRSRTVSDQRLAPLIEATLDRTNPRRWYSALMDYGSDLKRRVANPSRRSKHHVRQSRFEGSDRQIRGAILKTLLKGSATMPQLIQSSGAAPKRVEQISAQLVREKLIDWRGQRYRISGS